MLENRAQYRMITKARIAILGVGLLTTVGAAAEEIVVGPFSSGSAGGAFPSGWRIATLPNVAATRFRMVHKHGVVAVQMDAGNAAATLYRPVRIDPAKTPILRWYWRVRNLIVGADLRRKQGDDLPARLYVMFDYPMERLSMLDRTKLLLARFVSGNLVPTAALCYVWDGKLPAGTEMWNAYTDRVRMIVVESGSRRLGQWVTEERDVAADFRSAFGASLPPISGIAIAADTDQTGATVRSWFGDISFSARGNGSAAAGANVISEAAVAGVPVIASDMRVFAGLLGDEYLRRDPVIDEQTVAETLHRAESGYVLRHAK